MENNIKLKIDNLGEIIARKELERLKEIENTSSQWNEKQREKKLDKAWEEYITK